MTLVITSIRESFNVCIGVGRFRILVGGEFRILGGGGGGGAKGPNPQQAHDVVLTSMRRHCHFDVICPSYKSEPYNYISYLKI